MDTRKENYTFDAAKTANELIQWTKNLFDSYGPNVNAILGIYLHILVFLVILSHSNDEALFVLRNRSCYRFKCGDVSIYICRIISANNINQGLIITGIKALAEFEFNMFQIIRVQLISLCSGCTTEQNHHHQKKKNNCQKYLPIIKEELHYPILLR